MIAIDGARGEGGGQVLRSALTLSILTGKPFQIEHIRAGRAKPGLRAQHLTAVQAAAEICSARVQGDRMGSTALAFEPGPVVPGSYRFDIPTAGAASLVLQTVFLPLSTAGETSTVAVTGGTHVPWSPCFHYLDWCWLPALRELGFNGKLSLKRAGFYPQGGGRLQATIRPAGETISWRSPSRGPLTRITGLSAVANLPDHIAERQRKRAARRLRELCPVRIEQATLPAPSPGTFLCLKAIFENTHYTTFSLGEKGKPAEQVADEAVEALVEFLESGASVDRYLADQLLIPLALVSGRSSLHTARLTPHLLTNAHVLRAFLPVTIEIQGTVGTAGVVEISSAAS